MDKWTYITVDSTRTRHPLKTKGGGGWFGLAMADMTNDGYLDIVSGKWFYRNPGSDMSGNWERIAVFDSLDMILSLDVDDDKFADVIAVNLPDVYWLECEDTRGEEWNATRIGTIPRTKHGNGQGFHLSQIVPGGKPEIILSSGNGIYYFEIPDTQKSDHWPVTHITADASEEGIGSGDIDGDGDIDIAAGYGEKNEGQKVAWWENPGDGSTNWIVHHVGVTAHFADRVAIADIDNDGLNDIVVTEERWPGLEPDATLYWFRQHTASDGPSWKRHEIVTEYSLNNLSVVDMDQDSDADIVICEHKGPNEKLQIFENDGSGLFTEHLIDTGKESHLGAKVADMDGDGDLDIVSLAWDDYPVLHLWRNDALKNQ